MANAKAAHRPPVNYFDPTVSEAAKKILSTELRGREADIDQIVDTLSKWVGRYRSEEKSGWQTPAEELAEAKQVPELLRQLHTLLSDPTWMPSFRHTFLELLREHKVAYPDLPKLVALSERATQVIPTPTQGKKFGKKQRDDAIRETYKTIRACTSPSLAAGKSALLAAEVVGEALGIAAPKDRKELAKIVGES